MAYNTDYIARDWHLTYSRRKGVDDDDEGNLPNGPVAATSGTPAAGPGSRYRSYGEYGRPRQPARRHVQDGRPRARASSATCAPTTACRRRPASGSATPTTSTCSSSEFREFEKNGNLPRFIVMSLGEDHTDRHHARRVHAAGLRRQQRPGPRPAGRGGQPRASSGRRRRSS